SKASGYKFCIDGIMGGSIGLGNGYVDWCALLYLILAKETLHALHPNIITIAEDVSN
ncbi:hypothetical protein Tco_0437309, partial [Tanacetum coccineum]